MLKVYGAPICSGCMAMKEELASRNIPYEFIDITASVANLRAFLKLRDTREELRAAREEGRICIPTFQLDDGSITMDEQLVYAQAKSGKPAAEKPAAAPAEEFPSCGIDGHC